MNTRGVLIAHAVTIVSAGLYLSPSLISTNGYYNGYPGNYSYYDSSLLFRNILFSVGIAGMVVGPYFGVGALLAKKDESIWVLVNRLIHGHISIPFIGALALAWEGNFWAFRGPFFQGMVIVPYAVFLIIGTLITYMASRGTAARSSAPVLST